VPALARVERTCAEQTSHWGSGWCRSDFKVAAGWAMTRGRRVYNEDNVFCEFRNVSKGSSGAHEDVTELEVGCIGVFDGHGGAAASEYVKGNLFESILGNEKFPIDVFKALGK